jgi:hypothetical protein
VRAQSLPAPLPALLLSGQRSRVHLLTRHSGRSSSSGSSKALIVGDTASTTTSTAGSTRGSECLPPHSTMGGSSSASSSAATAPAVSFVPSGDCWVVLLVDKRWAATTNTDTTNATATDAANSEGFTLARATESASELAPAWLTRTGFRRAAHWSGVALTAPTALPPVPLEALPLQPFVRFCKGGVRVCLGSCATVGNKLSSSMKPPAQYGVLVVAATEHESSVECDATDAEGKAGYVECSTN